MRGLTMVQPDPQACSEYAITTGQLIEATGLTERRVSHWVESGYLLPAGKGGTGYPWQWPATEVEVARRIRVLADAGIAVEAAARFARDGWPDGPVADGLRLVITEQAGGGPP